MASGLLRPAGQLDAARALEPYAGPWSPRLAAHLLRRAGFGGSADEIARYAAMRPHEAVETLIRFPDTSALAGPPDVFDGTQALIEAFRADKQQRREIFNHARKSSRASIVSMQEWWLNRMLSTPAPLQEKMTYFLHGHFTTAAIQKGVWPNYVYAQNQLYRANALGNLRALTLAVSKDPAMLLYLDNAESNKAHPNENYARELMELFTLGHGNYSEEDVRQSARAFTGWTVNRREGRFVFNRRTHDDGVKTFLGQTGNFDGTDIVDIIYRQPACSKFWAGKLLDFFVYNDAEPELNDALAALIRKHDYEIAPVMSVLLQSNVFYSPRSYRALVKSPTEFVVGVHKSFGLAQIEPRSPQALRQMGQILFYPPNVAGWPGGENWITSQTMIARANFVALMVNSPLMLRSDLTKLPLNASQAARALIDAVLQGDAPAESGVQLQAYLNGSGTSALGAFSVENYEERARGAAYLAMAMPAYQLA
ncbi:MAG: DUF1800 domain-containing protein [bacterium]|nr:DUF1800 domain-containing protein [bacterium]